MRQNDALRVTYLTRLMQATVIFCRNNNKQAKSRTKCLVGFVH